MRAAKEPPTEAARQEATFAVDLLQRWKDDDKPLEGARPLVMACKVCDHEFALGTVTCHLCAPSMLSGMAPLLVERISTVESHRQIVARVVAGAVAEYLRRHPRARSDGRPWALHADLDPDSIPTAQRDSNIICLFCRASINTIGFHKSLPARSSAPRFWDTIEKHAWCCAAMYLAGMISPIKTIKRNEGRLPVSELKGGDLFVAAIAAAQYMEVPEPTPRKRGSGHPCTNSYWQRRMVADARKLADARMRLERDVDQPVACAGHRDEIDRLLHNIRELYVPPCLRGMGCLCAGHARGIPVMEPCDTREVRRGR